MRLSELPKCNERPQIAICCLEGLGKLKCLATGFDASLSFLSTSRRCSLNRSPSRCPVSPMSVYLFARSASYAIDVVGGGAHEVISDLNRLSPDILLALWMKGQVLHHA